MRTRLVFAWTVTFYYCTLAFRLCRVLDQYNEYGTVVPGYHSSPMLFLGKPEEFSVMESLLVQPEIYLISELQSELFHNIGMWASISIIF